MNSPNHNKGAYFSRRVHRVPVALGLLTLSALACRPVIAIGWPELLILVGIILFLFWPLLARVYRLLDKMKDASKKDDEKE